MLHWLSVLTLNFTNEFTNVFSDMHDVLHSIVLKENLGRINIQIVKY